jgi:hypothetical protein
MKVEAILFAGVTAFFAVSAVIYAAWAQEPAGTAALVVAAVMAALISFFLYYTHRRVGIRPEDSKSAEVVDAAGTVGFFPPDTAYPALTALGFALTAGGVALGLWLLLIGFGVLLPGVIGFVFGFGNRNQGGR